MGGRQDKTGYKVKRGFECESKTQHFLPVKSTEQRKIILKIATVVMLTNVTRADKIQTVLSKLLTINRNWGERKNS